jgi:hypothetical protein
VRILAYVVMLAVLAWVWHRVQPPWWDTSGDVAELQDNQQEGAGYEGADEYVPAGGDAYELNKDARRVTYDGPGNSRVRITQWAPESRAFSAYVSQPGKLVLRLFNYPAWQVEVNGHAVQTGKLEKTAQMVIPVESGENRVRVRFVRTADRTLGGFISFGTGVLLLGIIISRRLARGS